MRARILASLAALAMLAGACATVPGDAVATVNGQPIDYDHFERIVAAQVVNAGLTARDAQVAQQAIDAGILDRAAIDEALQAELRLLREGGDSELVAGPPLEVPQEFIDDLFEQHTASGDELEQQLSDLGLSVRRYREVFERFVRFEVRGLQMSETAEGEFRTGFPIDRTQQVAAVQQSIIQQLVQAEIARQAVEELDLEVPEETISQIEGAYLDSFQTEEALDAALEDAGYTRDDFEELIVATQARQQALQSVDDPAAAQAFFNDLDVDVATRFGRWDTQQGTVVAPTSEL